MTDRTCTAPGCARKHRARGLCSTHYNQTLPVLARHPRELRDCVVCGTTVVRTARRVQRYRPTCSTRCRTLLQHGPVTRASDWTTDAMRRARRQGATDVQPIDRLEVFDRDGWRCYLCAVPVLLGDAYSPRAATVDHVLPLSLGGQHTLDNVRGCCASCNSSKQDRVLALAG